MTVFSLTQWIEINVAILFGAKFDKTINPTNIKTGMKAEVCTFSENVFVCSINKRNTSYLKD